jgi:superfamily II DNA or RNA helicase
VIADLCHVCEFPAEHSLICECGIRLCMFCRERHQELCTGRRTPDVEPDDSDHGVECDAFTPRPYQQEAYSNAMADLNGKSQSSLVVMPTGTGKTVLFGLIARDWPNGKVLVVAHREELIFQAADKIEQICGDRPDIEMADLRAGQNEIWTNSHVVITSVQTMSRERRQSRFKPEEFGLVIIDEAHHAVATTYKKVLDYFGQNPNLKILGVTATPDRADEEALGQVFESVAYDYQIPNAVHDGWLVPIDQQFVYVEGLDLSACKTTAGDLNSGDLARIMEQEEMLHKVVAPTIELAGDRPTLVFASSVAHADRMAEIFNRHQGDSAVCLHGNTPTEDRRRHLERFKRGEFQYLCNCGLFLEGFDCPSIAVVAMARPTKSRALYAQCVGRGTRPLPGLIDGLNGPEDRKRAILSSSKPSVLVLDFVGNSGKHKLVTTADILGGNYSDEVVSRAESEVKKKGQQGKSADMLEEIKKAAQQIEEEAKRKRRQIIATAKFGTKNVNPFDVFDISPTREPGWFKGKRPTERMVAMLEKAGIADAAKKSFWECKQLIGEMVKRRERGLCSYKQAKILAKYGYDGSQSFQEASGIIDRLAKNNWKPLVGV